MATIALHAFGEAVNNKVPVMLLCDGNPFIVANRVPDTVPRTKAAIEAWIAANVGVAETDAWAARAAEHVANGHTVRVLDTWKREALVETDLDPMVRALMEAVVVEINARFQSAGLAPITKAAVLARMKAKLNA